VSVLVVQHVTEYLMSLFQRFINVGRQNEHQPVLSSMQEWAYFLNKGALIEAAYSVQSETDVPYPLCVVIAQGETFSNKTEDMLGPK
jgi:hypothetical protein